jgi:hypothetical protein
MAEYAINSFASGEISPEWYGRSDLENYRRSAKRLLNMLVLPTGAVQKRPGTLYIATTKNSGAANDTVRLVPFQTSATDGVVIEFGHQYVRFHTTTGPVMDGAAPYQVTTTYAAADVAGLRFVQVLNVLYIFSRTLRPRTLTYTSATSWAIADLSLTVFASWSQDLISSGQTPGAATVYDQRLFVGGTTNAPGTFWGSKPAIFNDFNVTSPAIPEDSVQYSPQSFERLDIRWMLGGDYLILGTTDGLWAGFGPDRLVDGTGTSTYYAKRQSAVGSANVQAILVNDFAFFVERGGKRIRSARFNNDQQQFVTPAVSISAQHYFEDNPARELHYQLSPDPTLYVVRESGGLAAFCYSEETGTAGWSELDFGGDVMSAAVLKGVGEDAIFVAVQRDSGLYIEKLANRVVSAAPDAHHVDSGVQKSLGAAKTVEGVTLSNPVVIESTGHGLSTGDYVRFTGVGGTSINGRAYQITEVDANEFEIDIVDGGTLEAWTGGGTFVEVAYVIDGLGHLNGQTVAVWADGAVQADRVVAGGSVTLARAANKASVGLPFTGRVETLPMSATNARLLQVYNTVLRFAKTIGAKIGEDDDSLEVVQFLESGFVMDEGPPYFTGLRLASFGGRPNYEGQLLIVSDQPAPMTLLSITAEMRVGDSYA